MRVLHISHRYWPAVGGAETYLGELSRRLAAGGHEVTVATTDALDFELLYTPGRRRIAERETERAGVRVLRFPVRHLPFSPLAYAGWRRLLWALSTVRPVPVQVALYLARYAPRVPELEGWLLSTDEPYDLVAGMNICFESLSAAGLRLAKRRRIPFVMHPLTHLGAGDRPGSDRVGRSYTMRHQLALVRASDAVVAQTPTERAFYVQNRVPQERIHVIGPGVDPAEVLGGDGRRFRERHNVHGPLVFSLSAMTHDKGTVQVVEAVRHLWRAGVVVELALAGTVLTPFRDYLARLPSQDRERIRVLGPIGEGEKRDLLAACDVLAMPSRTDSFGIVYLEAWLYRKPVIGARAWGIGDVIEDGVDGLLVPFGDPRALAEALSSLLGRPTLCAEMGVRGEQKVYRLHTWETKYRSVRNLYAELASRHKNTEST